MALTGLCIQGSGLLYDAKTLNQSSSSVMQELNAELQIVDHPRASWQWSRTELEQWQLKQLNRQLSVILSSNRFYREKFRGEHLQLDSLRQLQQLPCTSKAELMASIDESGLSAHQTFHPTAYSRLHRTSGTTGTPMIILDTQTDWCRWWSSTWQHVLEAANVIPQDRVFLAFSFGPFIGFWSAHQACTDRGCTVIPGGGLSSLARLEFLRQTQASVLLCTPSYALHLAEVAEREQLDLHTLAIRRVIVAGEAGGSIPSVRRRIERAWNSNVIDHCGATEVGPWGFGWPDRPGIHIIETSFIAELQPLDGSPTILPSDLAQHDTQQTYELLLTSLGRWGAPVFRYRTGDIVNACLPPSGECRFLWLEGGVRGRTDDMLTIRGVNVFPSSIDAILREFDCVSEYRVLISRQGQLDEIHVEVEAPDDQVDAIRNRLDIRLGLRIQVTTVPPASLARHELKANRWIDQRGISS
jgi:phenylacetate-CoA ligase